MHSKIAAAIALIACAASCAGNKLPEGGFGTPTVTADTYSTSKPIPMDPARKIAVQDCSKALVLDRGNILCK